MNIQYYSLISSNLCPFAKQIYLSANQAAQEKEERRQTTFSRARFENGADDFVYALVFLLRLSKRMEQQLQKKSNQRASHQIVTANQCACASDRIGLIYVQFAHCAIVMISDCRHVIMYMRAIISRSA